MSARAERTLGLLRELSGSHAAAPGDRLEDVGIDSLRPGVVKVRVSFAAPIEVDRVDDPVERRARVPEVTAEVRIAIERRLASSAEGRAPGGP